MNTGVISARFQLNHGNFLFDVDLALPGSGVTVLLGPSGCGKTTLLRCMAGLEQALQGYFGLNSTIWQDSSRQLFVPTYRRNLGYVFQEANLFPHLNVSGNLRYGLKRIKQQADHAASVDKVVDLLGIGHLLDRMPDRLSGGEKQRVAIARALVMSPQILLMDEPLASLDDKRKQEVMPYLHKLQEEFAIPIVYVTHSRQEAAQLADYLVLLDNGQVQAAGDLNETLGRLDLPLAKETQASVVWCGAVTAHEPDFGLTIVATQGGQLRLPALDMPTGTKVRVQIYAIDVSVTLQKSIQTSVLNILPATVANIAKDIDNHRVVLQLQVGGESLLAHITLKSAHLLNLQIGKLVYVQIKGTSLLH